MRCLAAENLRMFRTTDVIKDLKYFGRSDPAPEVRRVCIITIKEMDIAASKFFYEMCFDPTIKVRLEAFRALATRPMGALSTEKQEKVIFWGLNQTERKYSDKIMNNDMVH